MDHHAIVTVLAYLLSALIAVPLFRKLGLGAILGYLVAGAVIGPQILAVITDPQHALHFAEFGVVMLLFVIGLELNPEKLWNMRAQISLLGGGQLLLSAVAISAIFFFVFGFNYQVSILLGLTLGLSSTAFAVQLMDENGIMGLSIGRKGFAILLLQDLAVIPILLLVSLWAPNDPNLTDVHAPAWWVGPLAIIAVLIGGRFAINPALKLITKYGSKEVLTAASLFIVLGTAFLMQSVGFSMGMGAFLAGIILANSSYRHQLEADIEPFKGLLLGLFFIAVGMSLDLQLLISKPILIFALALILMLSKALIIAALLKLKSIPLGDGFCLGLMLSQGGEFAFVVVAKMVGLGVLQSGIGDYVIVVVGVSMALTAPLLMLFKRITQSKNTKSEPEFDKIESEEPEVIIAGFGRFGQIIGRILAANNLHFTALDKDPSHVDFVKQFGNKIYFGDATRTDLMQAAGLEHARLLVIAVDDVEDSLQIAELIKKQRPDLRIVARARNRAHVYSLRALGVEIVIRETFESGLSAARDTLMHLGYTEGQAIAKVELFRKHDEELLDRASAHKDDFEKQIALANEGRMELENLFQDDTSK